jgi:hypothetical protein
MTEQPARRSDQQRHCILVAGFPGQQRAQSAGACVEKLVVGVGQRAEELLGVPCRSCGRPCCGGGQPPGGPVGWVRREFGGAGGQRPLLLLAGVEVGAFSVVVEDDQDLDRSLVGSDGVRNHGGELGGVAGLDQDGSVAQL